MGREDSGNHSAPETPIFIAIDHLKELIDRRHDRRRLVSLPLQAGAHPENLPAVSGADIGGLGEWPFMDDLGIVPLLSLIHI